MRKTLILILSALPALCFAGGIGPYLSYISIDDADETEGYGAKLEVDFSSELALEGRISRYSNFDTDTTVQFFNVPGELEFTPIDIGLVARIPVQDKILPYLGGGLTYLQVDIEIAGEELEFDDEFGWYAFGGLRLGLSSSLSLFGEVQYRQIEGTVKGRALRAVGIREIDVDLQSLGANVGLMLNW